MLFPQLAWAGRDVQINNVAHGSAALATIGRNTTITVSNGAIVNYNVFNIPTGSTVTFVEPSAASRVLNRIDSNTPSFLNGTLSANGIVYFVNPAGITFGPNSVINVGQLYAAAGNMADSDFLNHVDRFTGAGPLVNQGQITAGNVVLAGSTITNSGAIFADKGLVLMTTGSGVYLGESGDPIYVQVNPPTAASAAAAPAKAPVTPQPIQPAAEPSTGVGDMYWTALTNTGTVRASNITMAGGSGAVNVSGKLDASGPTGGNVAITGAQVNLASANINASGPAGGGTVQIGGRPDSNLPQASSVSLDASTVIDADATSIGNGGNIVIWSDGLTSSAATLTARGGPLGGNGGFIETSGEVVQVFSAPNASSPFGKAGTWLVDPIDIEIVNGANNGQITGVSTITNGTIEATLDGGTNLVITTDQGGGDNGVLTQDADATINVAPSSPVELTLQANSTAAFNGGIVQSGGSNLSVEIDELGNSTVTVNAPISIGGTFTSLGGNFALVSGGSISAQAVFINNSTTTGMAQTVTPGSNSIDGPVFTLDGEVSIGGTGLTTGGSGSMATIGGNVVINTTGDIVIGANINTGGGAFSATGNSFENDAEISDGGTATAGNPFTVDTTSGSGSISINGEISWTGGTGRNVLIQGNGPITVTSAGEIDQSGLTALPVEIDNLDSTGLITIAGPVNTSGTYTSEGGDFEISSTGSITALAAAINTSTSTSNSLTVTPGSTTLNGPAITEGGDFDVGGTTFSSDSTGTITTNGGGAILDLSGGVTVQGAISTSGTSGSSGGNAGALSITGSGTLELSAHLTADGGGGSAGNGGNGGIITLSGFTTNSFTPGIVIDASGGNSVGGSSAGSGGQITVTFGTGDTSINLGAETFKAAGGTGGTAGGGGELFFNGSSAATAFTVPAFNAASATVTGQAANDSAVITGLGPANLTVNLAGGANTFEFSLSLLSGNPASLTLQGTTGGTLILDGSSGNDAFTVTSTTVSLASGGSFNYSSGQDFANLEIQGFGGNDTFTVNSTSIATTIYGGTASSSLAGNDTFTVNGVSNDPLTLVGDASTNAYVVNISSGFTSNVILQSSVSSAPSQGNGTDYLAINGTGNLSVATSSSDIVARDSAASSSFVDFQSIMPHLAGLLLDSTGAASGSSGSISVGQAIAIPGAGNGAAVNGVSPGISINGNLGTPPSASTVAFTSPGTLNAGNSPITILAGSTITLRTITTADTGHSVIIFSDNGSVLDGTAQSAPDISAPDATVSVNAGLNIGASAAAPLLTSALNLTANAGTGVNINNTDPAPSNSSNLSLASSSGAITLVDTGNPTLFFSAPAGAATANVTGTLTVSGSAGGPVSLTASGNVIFSSTVTSTSADSGSTSAVSVHSGGNILDGTNQSATDIAAVNGSASLSAGGTIGAFSPSSLPLITSVLAITASGPGGVNVKNTDPGPSNSSLLQLTSTSGAVSLSDTGNPTVSFESNAAAAISATGMLTFGPGTSGAVTLGSSSTASGALTSSAVDINVNEPISGSSIALTALDSGNLITINTGGSISATGLVTLTAPDVDIVPTAATTVSSTTEVDLVPLISSPSAVSVPVVLGSGSASGTFTMTSAELGAITAPLLKIGTVANPADGIQVLAAVNITHVPVVHMYSSANVTTADAASASPVDLIEVVGGAGSLALTSSAGSISVGTQVTTLSASAAGSVFIYDSSNLGIGTVDSQAGVVSGNSTAAIDLSAGSTLTTSAQISAAQGGVTLTADSMALDAPIHAGTHLVTLDTVTAGRAITLGVDNQAGTLALGNDQLNQILDAGALRIGSSSSGAVTIAGPVSLADVSLVQILSGGSITSSSASDTFGFSSSGSVALNSGSNINVGITNVAQLAAAANGSVDITNASSSLTVTSLSFTSFGLAGDTVTGITSNGNAISISSPGLTNDSTISAGVGNIEIAADTLSLAGGSLVSGTGTLTVKTLSANQLIDLGSAAGGGAGVQISQTNFTTNLGQNFQSITIEQAAGVHDASHVITIGTLTSADALVIGSNTPAAGAHDIDITSPITDRITANGGIVFSGTVDVPGPADVMTISAGTSAVEFLGNVGSLQAPASLDVTAGAIILGGSAGSSIQMNSSGPMTFNGPVTTGGGSFAMNAGGNVTFADNITSAGGNVAVTSGGNITVVNVSSNGTVSSPNAGSITLQPGASGNLILDPSPDASVAQINISAEGDGGSNGAISLEPAGYSTIPVAATLYASYGGNGGTSNVTIAGGAITFGKGSRTTVIGNLTIAGSAAVTLSDISVLGQLTVDGSPIIIQTRSPGTQLLNNQGQIVPVPGGFSGVGFVAGQGITFSQAPQTSGTGAAPEFATPSAQNISGNLSGFVTRSFPQAVTISLLEYDNNGSFTILSLSPAGTTTTDFASVIAGAVPRQIPQASDDIAASPSQELELETLGIDARPLPTEELVGFLIGGSLYNDLPPDVSDNQRLVSPSRLYSKAVQDVLSAYDEIFFATTTDQSGAQVRQSQYSQIRAVFVRAQLAFAASHRGTAITPDNFRAFILSDPDQGPAAEKLAQLADLFQKMLSLGLNQAEYAQSRDVILGRIAPPGLSAGFMYALIVGPGQ